MNTLQRISPILVVAGILLMSACSKRSDIAPISAGKEIQINENSRLSANATNRIQLTGKNTPLIIVDGKEWTAEQLEKKISPDDITSIEVFKSGKEPVQLLEKLGKTKAENGILIVRTKAGKKAELPAALYLVDGKEMDQQSAEKISPDKIESINVLKDAKGVEKYGEKAKNGVIMITLKK
ncbi:SusC/RagA family TonB-linked outer membrane protein [Siphonobacter curvatus]|nr:TonB-dependent receptor plug domain-containing protein [Siphonobacter curvatus]